MKGLLKTTVKIDLGEIHKGDLLLGSQLPDVKVSELLEGANQRVIIFDDFERAKMPPVELLGYINPLVEHDGCKVIILANEAEIKDEDGEYKQKKEKTIGQTLEVVADAAAAFPAFLAEVDTRDLREFYTRHQKEIEILFSDSGLDNLRLLKQFLWDFEKYWATLTERHRRHDAAMLEVMLLLCALTLELRSGRVDATVLNYNQVAVEMSMINRSDNEQHRPNVAMRRSYSSVDFQSSLIAVQTIWKIILNSAFPKDEI